MFTSRILPLATVFTNLVVLAACATPPAAEPEPAPTEAVVVEEDEREVVERPAPLVDSVLVGADWLEANLDNPRVVVVHIGMNYDDWVGAHIPGQSYVAFEDIVEGDFPIGFWLPPLGEARRAFEQAGVDDGSQVVLTGDFDGLTATRAFFTLEVLGLNDGVALLDGGLAQWRDEGRITSDTPATPSQGRITARPSTQMVLDAEEVLDRLEDPAYQLVDARPPTEFTGAVAGDGVARPGHIPGATNIFWKETIQVDDRALMRSTEEISELYREAGVSEDATLIAYCRTGMQASFGYFLGRLLDREALIYDGSYIDWAGDPERPIATSP